MNKVELVTEIAEVSGLKKIEAEKALDAFVRVVEKALAKGDEIRLVGFGTFSVSKRAATEGRNPKTGAPISIPERKVPKFKPGKQLKDCACGCNKKGCGKK
ncbi:MAG: HU family DNA-binding protein [Holosporales bacterium]|jgi:DNA-binding protein HU-beta|nr:HU family DNA-binding protein [Holosporales bacterium]